MKTSIYIGIIFTLLTIHLSAQNFEGIAIYKTSSMITMTMDSTKVSTQEQEALNAMIRKSMQKDYELKFNRTESIYELIETLELKDGSQGVEVIGLGSGTEGGLYKDIKDLILVENRDVFGKLFLVRDSLETYDWQLENETREIGEYLCHKATAKIVDIKTIKKMNEKGIEIEEQKEIIKTITAWYTPQIPISTGPASYWGLPGLILELDNGRLSMICSKIIINPEEEISIEMPTNGKVVNNKEYEMIYTEKVNEMQEMYKEKRKKNN